MCEMNWKLGFVSGVLLVCSACGPTTKLAQVEYPSLVSKEPAEQKAEGLIVTVVPIQTTNQKSFPQVYKTWTIPYGERTVTAKGTLVPVPGSFQVRLVNNTDHVIRLTEVVFRLEDDQGNRYEMIPTKDELVAWNLAALNDANGNDPHFVSEMTPKLQTDAASVPLLNRTVELLKGDQWSGYLVFRTPVNSAEAALEFLNKINRLKLRLAELPIGLDEAGKVSKTQEVTFNFDRTLTPVDAVCPVNAEPSLTVCTIAD